MHPVALLSGCHGRQHLLLPLLLLLVLLLLLP
jgi:hypothetical protein